MGTHLKEMRDFTNAATQGFGRATAIALASDESAFTTVHVHVIDGGWSAF